MKDEDEERHFRRLYMGIWPTSTSGQWLDMLRWDLACEGEFSPPADAPVYVGIDLSQCDDLSAVVFIHVTPERFYLSSHFWLPRVTADKYEAKHAIPYHQWAKDGYMTLVDEPTISTPIRKRIADYIISHAQDHEVKAVCYDRYKADETVAALESAGLTCTPVPQGYSVSPGTQELDRRLKEQSISIQPNPVLRFCAENTEIKADDRGNIWPVKPGRKGKFAGQRHKKIDGISAAVTALTEARKFSFPSQKQWKGNICLV